ncbi:expressed unknown protein [Seminavis robusta]|uniref:PDZ domain-containing protein n=1 Tax=Seminavis robusta TaxID=568900 RepID=A0A9N8HVR2_9STRA|nr:expressed unknown protein [Seminavis robusta]|eukprot:Sro1541_g280890.1 n/a (1796) ;mRNA; f:6720-12184
MADNSNGGIVKKLLFPASSSGANDTFRSPVVDAAGNNNAFSPYSPPMHMSFHPQSSSQMMNRAMAPTLRDTKQAVAAPPRFFSSTHPSADGDGRKQQPLQTPARVPSSPPLLNRQPVTPSSEMDTKATSANGRNGTQRRLFAQSSSMSVAIDDTMQPLHASSSEGGEHRHHGETVGNDFANDDSSLQFLNDFKAIKLQRQTNLSDDQAETEVHANTTTKSFQKQKQQHEVLVAATKLHLEESTQATPSLLDTDEGPTAAATILNDAAETHDNSTNDGFQSNDADKEDDDRGDDSSMHELHSYPSYSSYWDNPFHNPLASAVKPNDLFRKEGDKDTSMESDINSNASEMGTVIGGPVSLMAERFAEVDEMEREGRLAMQLDESGNADPVHDTADNDIFDDEVDPSMVSYQAFRVNDDEDEVETNASDRREIDESLFSDPFQTPSSAPPAITRLIKGNAIDDDSERKEGEQIEGSSKHEATGEEGDEPQTVHESIRDADLDEAALSVVDSEIGQLIRQNASENAGNGRLLSCSSNNSAEVFRTSSIGSEQAAQAKAQSRMAMGFKAISAPSEEVDRADNEVDAINDSPSCEASSDLEQSKRRSSSSLQRALRAREQPETENDNEGSNPRLGHEEKKLREDEKEEKEEELLERQKLTLQQYRFEVPMDSDTQLSEVQTGVNASHVAAVGISPGRGFAGTLRRIGSKLESNRPSPSSKSATQYMFDLEDDEDDNFDNNQIQDHGSFSAPSSPGRGSFSAPSSPGQNEQQATYLDGPVSPKIQEVFPQSPRQSNSLNLQTEQEQDPAELLLRSPGKSARLMADFRRQSSSSSGFTGNTDGHMRYSAADGRVPSMLHSESSNSLGNGPTPRSKGTGMSRDVANFKSAGANALRLARGFLSFDHLETDEGQNYNLESSSFDKRRLESSLSFDSRLHRFRGSKHKAEDKAGTKGGGRTQALFGSNRSWDVSSGMASSATRPSVGSPRSDPITEIDEHPGPAAVTLDASAFRVAPYVRLHQQQHHPHAHGYNNANNRRLVSGERRERLMVMNESSVLQSKRNNEALELLQTPQRIEIEREDALNLLSMLCERGIALRSDETELNGPNNSETQIGDVPVPETDEAETNTQECGPQNETEEKTLQLDADVIDAAVAALREISGGGRPDSEQPDHSVRMSVLDCLVDSHIYAHEMKRASLSASAWLRSIGHTEKKGTDADHPPAGEAGLQAPGEEEEETEKSSKAAAIEVQALKAMLHQAQMEAHEKDEAARQLNAELSQCRAEIGRLKSVSRSKTSFTSPNRSILDDEEDSVASEVMADGVARVEFTNNIADESVVDLDSSLFVADQDGAEVVRESDQPVVRELAMFKSALSDANAIIKKLHDEIQDAKPDNEAHTRTAPVIEVSQKAFSVALVDESTSNVEKSPGSASDSREDHRMVNVRMLDAENFVTDWDHLESLPPPPDHGLRAPIVLALLQQWSPDEGLQKSLLSWCDQAMSGADPSTIPPLTLSSLDHQVRDGFTMHVLPLLLRRPDILVDVQQRTHRKTTYDVAVSLKRNPRSPSMQSIRYMEHESNPKFSSTPEAASAVNSATHSAITTHIHNGTSPRRDLHDVGSTVASYTAGSSNYSTLLPHRSSDDKSDKDQHSGLMSALGGALGGLLSRRKPAARHYDAGIPANSSFEWGSAAGAVGPGIMDFPPSPRRLAADHADSEEPYHRLVSAPPGRIGVSFVEYRGHAMVSDVAEDSPLLGWIFPSDILIAIDEKAVTGMRLKDIVKVLQGRNDRQRALRVISSCAMQEITMSFGSPNP